MKNIIIHYNKNDYNETVYILNPYYSIICVGKFSPGVQHDKSKIYRRYVSRDKRQR
ncbi:hypothetical protein UABAM_04482 [Candidatus Uabimicrobium amorphum]|uniref:Uncharacterized protein n=1 Tax=Uabimicrobium amorphum TaxID=2596890 RepID=A0A5S9IR48_UABAM|nr:hypothetical protein UABAM_04482 [Candidatus Uabimicrobium amorphum]